MAIGFPSGTNTWVPGFTKSGDASGHLVVEFVKSPSKFAINSYLQMQEADMPSSYYLKINPEEAARVISSDGNEDEWPDGADAPAGIDKPEGYEFILYKTRRYARPFRVGDRAVKYGAWDILASNAAIAAQGAMTRCSLQVVTKLETASLYGTNTGAAASANLGGGFLDAGSNTDPRIQKAFLGAAEVIHKRTLGALDINDLHVIMSPDCARKLAVSPEFHNFIAQSPDAYRQITGEIPGNRNKLWGLPEKLYGFTVDIEDTVRVSSQKKPLYSSTPDYAKSNNSIVMVSRQGPQEVPSGTSNWSSCMLFYVERMTVETKYDADNRRHKGRVVDDYAVEFVSPESAFLITNVFS